ncbi:hypothetical protein FH972_025730 [Carpinus fangiana]|uniref:Stc1 domain-containing protein n=1 Tax=Carpinus fangiana TaxID=176857 RepID=A0A5N6L286_9ROSI|nr:hypothetical protein FH972_025730 [Carpinus fangiana]
MPSMPSMPPIPSLTRTKCLRCREVKGVNDFSTKEHEILLAQIKGVLRSGGTYYGHIERGWVICKSCQPELGSELQCTMCLETKVRDDFAKNQRKPGVGVSLVWFFSPCSR